MSQGPDPTDERRRRLDAIRAELTSRQAAGQRVDWAAVIGREPDLAADLVGMIEEFRTRDFALESGATVALGDDPGGTINVDQSTVAPAAIPETRLADETVAGDSEITLDQDSATSASFEVDPPPAPKAGPGTRVRYIGDYELLSILGQGGMGVVFRARQVSLNRQVALKMIRNAEFANEDQVRRFRNEAEAVATLDHPGIVPIYEVGTYEDQRYFSMKLVDGAGMDNRLEALAADPKSAARIMAEIADAIHHAHQRGILHRDMKPANILIDGMGHPHVTDFGLAKRIDEEVGLTVTGAVMGTPAYMAPEQALGQTAQITTASDVYGIGAILYSALTGVPPFRGDSVLNTLDRVRSSPPDPPSRVNADVPRDLEVICLKALEKEPRRRYASAQALADDLRRWLGGEPIAARPVGPAARAWMWARRQPALAGLSAGLAAALVAGVVGIAYQWRQAVAERDRAGREAVAARRAEAEAQAQRDRAGREAVAARQAEGQAQVARDAAQGSEKAAVAARALAEQNAQTAGVQATLALSTIQFLLTQIVGELNGPGQADLKAKLLGVVLERVNLVADSYDKSTSREATALVALMGLGDIYRQLGRADRAEAQFRRAQEIARERVKIKAGSDPSRLNLARTCRELANIAEDYRLDLKASLAANTECLAIFRDIDEHPKLDGTQLPRPQVRANLADAYGRVGRNYRDLGDRAAARDNFLRAYNLRRELADAAPADPSARQELGYSLLALAEADFRLGASQQAEGYYRQALELREALAEKAPQSVEFRKELSDVEYMLGEYKLRTGDLADARRRLERSRAIRQAIADADPEDALIRRFLTYSRYRLGNLEALERHPDAARQQFEAAAQLAEGLTRLSETNDARQAELMLALAHLPPVDRAVELADRLAAGPRVDVGLRIDLARSYAQSARSLPGDQAERAATLLVRAVESLRAAARDGYRDHVNLATEPDLAPLRDRDDFKTLLADLAKPAG